MSGGGAFYKNYLIAKQDNYFILEVDYYSQFVQKNLTKNQYIIGDVHNKYMFRDDLFDVILLFEVIEHVHNPFRAINNCAKWLKPGGRLIISAPQYWHIHGWPSDYFRYTALGLKELAKTAKLDVIDSWPMGGPCVLIWCAIKLNFRLLQLPIIDWLITTPFLLLARLGDLVFFRNKNKDFSLDTRGWIIVLQKAKSDY